MFTMVNISLKGPQDLRTTETELDHITGLFKDIGDTQGLTDPLDGRDELEDPKPDSTDADQGPT